MYRIAPVATEITSNNSIARTSGNAPPSSQLSIELLLTQRKIHEKTGEIPFSKLQPRARFIDLARKDTFSFTASICGFFLGIYLVFRSFEEVVGLPSLSAWADDAKNATSRVQFVNGSSRDAFDWYIGGLMGAILLISVIATYIAQNEKKIEFGKDTTKTIVGFAIGFLSGGKIV